MVIRHWVKRSAIFAAFLAALGASVPLCVSWVRPPKIPVVRTMYPEVGRRGHSLRITFEGECLDKLTELVSTCPGMTWKFAGRPLRDRLSVRRAKRVRVEARIPVDAPPGAYLLSLKNRAGQTEARSFLVDAFGVAAEREPNDSPPEGQEITLPTTLTGSADRDGDIDYYRFRAEAGQEIGAEAVSAYGSPFQAHLEVTDLSGRALVESETGTLGFRCERNGTYALGIRDCAFRGGPSMSYRLQVGNLPVITSVFPLGLQRGTEAPIQLEGVNLGPERCVRVRAPGAASPETKLPVVAKTPNGQALGGPFVMVGAFPEVGAEAGGATRAAGNANAAPRLPVPGTANGRIEQPGATGTWRFSARKGQRLIVETHARRLGSPLDSVIDILDERGRPVPRATLRATGQVSPDVPMEGEFDAATPIVMMQPWNLLAFKDYLYIGSELLRVSVPANGPNDLCQFFSLGGARAGYLDTTPTQHARTGEPGYKVELLPPGTTAPPNGYPVFHLNYRNDDGGAGYGKDSRLFFDPPADGDYLVRVGDALNQGGREFAYRLTVRPPQPDFQVHCTPAQPSVEKGGAVPVTVTADRIDGFEGPIDVRFDEVPEGYRVPTSRIPATVDTTTVALAAPPDAAASSKVSLKVVARALVEGREVFREATLGPLSVTDPGDFELTVERPEVIVPAGGTGAFTVRVNRRNGFTDRVLLELQGLPPGISIRGINVIGIVIPEQESTRTLELAAEAGVQPLALPITAVARQDSVTARKGASVLLRVVPGAGKQPAAPPPAE